jgi:hypothetical protein
MDVSEPRLPPLAIEVSAYAAMLHALGQIAGRMSDLNILYLGHMEGMTFCSPAVSASRK